MMNYSPSNGTEWELFLENNCYHCQRYDARMREDRGVNTCDILFKLLEQMALKEEDFPDIYQFKDDELADNGSTPECLKKIKSLEEAKKLWKGEDAQEYVNKLRKEWDERDNKGTEETYGE